MTIENIIELFMRAICFIFEATILLNIIAGVFWIYVILKFAKDLLEWYKDELYNKKEKNKQEQHEGKQRDKSDLVG